MIQNAFGQYAGAAVITGEVIGLRGSALGNQCRQRIMGRLGNIGQGLAGLDRRGVVTELQLKHRLRGQRLDLEFRDTDSVGYLDRAAVHRCRAILTRAHVGQQDRESGGQAQLYDWLRQAEPREGLQCSLGTARELVDLRELEAAREGSGG
jgi:hypothetical protein